MIDAVNALIVDAGVGNLGNLARAIEHVGGRAEITADPDRVAGAHCLFLPGVGAFGPPREAVRGGLEEALRAAIVQGAWLLGICVGFPILFESGQEFGVTAGLGLLPGRVTRLPRAGPAPGPAPPPPGAGPGPPQRRDPPARRGESPSPRRPRRGGRPGALRLLRP